MHTFIQGGPKNKALEKERNQKNRQKRRMKMTSPTPAKGPYCKMVS
jgi:hypothetical protein